MPPLLLAQPVAEGLYERFTAESRNPRRPVAGGDEGPLRRDLDGLERIFVPAPGDLEGVDPCQELEAGNPHDRSPPVVHDDRADRDRENALVRGLQRGSELELVEDPLEGGSELVLD